jgi:hypothetical protein
MALPLVGLGIPKLPPTQEKTTLKLSPKKIKQ